MASGSFGRLIAAASGVSPRAVLAQCGFEALAALCGLAAAGFALAAAWVEMAALWGPQVARLVCAGGLACLALGLHQLAERRRRRGEAEAALARASLAQASGAAGALAALRVRDLAPLAAFVGAFALARRAR